METIWIILGAVCIIFGLVGSFLPSLPGLPFSYLGLLILHFSGIMTFSTSFFVIWMVVIISIIILENVLPAFATRKFGGTTYGSMGSIIGMLVGLFFFPPLGFLLGMLFGAFIGEILNKRDVNIALKSAWGSFLAVITGIIVKIIVATMLAAIFLRAVF